MSVNPELGVWILLDYVYVDGRNRQKGLHISTPLLAYLSHPTAIDLGDGKAFVGLPCWTDVTLSILASPCFPERPVPEHKGPPAGQQASRFSRRCARENATPCSPILISGRRNQGSDMSQQVLNYTTPPLTDNGSCLAYTDILLLQLYGSSDMRSLFFPSPTVGNRDLWHWSSCSHSHS